METDSQKLKKAALIAILEEGFNLSVDIFLVVAYILTHFGIIKIPDSFYSKLERGVNIWSFILTFVYMKLFSDALNNKKIFKYYLIAVILVVLALILFPITLILSDVFSLNLIVVFALVAIPIVLALIFYFLAFYQLASSLNRKRIFYYRILQSIPIISIIAEALLIYEFYRIYKGKIGLKK